ncbi:transferase family-domain-containing protein [Polychytrium aggregatum]|uniref:transferase family-domain-containing protein n=1 Tax=Polychytrium aggregatum TaxID=110093 RepID=UPI0022FDE12A|nr:transferase family-domain-containing protein [Polychytrium aggregatum]KAI9207332.1 transferase family-domain-containing protein [Polychytrium aggregatum]
MDTVAHVFLFALVYIYPPGEYPQSLLEESFWSVMEDYPILFGRVQHGADNGSASVLIDPELKPLLLFVDRPEDHIALAQERPLNLLPLRDERIFAVKVSKLAHGALSIGLSAHHSVLDGDSMFQLMESWGRAFRGQSKLMPCHDRSLLFSTGPPARAHPEYFTVPVPIEALQAKARSSSGPPSTTSVSLYLSPEELVKLKNWTNPPDQPAGHFASTMDSFIGLVTMVVGAARDPQYSFRSSNAINGRAKLGLPPNYFGNAVFTAIMEHRQEWIGLDQDKIAQAARRVRQGIERTSAEFMRDTVNYLDTQPRQERIVLSIQIGKDFIVSSWSGMGLLKPDFGSKPVYAGPVRIELDGCAFILDSPQGGLEACVSINKSVGERLPGLWQSVRDRL